MNQIFDLELVILYVARKRPYILKIHTPKSLQIYVNGLSILFKARVGVLHQI